MCISNESTDIFVRVSPGIKAVLWSPLNDSGSGVSTDGDVTGDSPPGMEALRPRLNSSGSGSGAPVKGDETGGALNKNKVLRRPSLVSRSGVSGDEDVASDESVTLEDNALCLSVDDVNNEEPVVGILE